MTSARTARPTPVLVWILLVTITVVSVLAHVLLDVGAPAVVVVLAATFVKVWLIGRHFMELHTAQPTLRRLFDAYVVVVPVVLAVVLLSV